jgi:dipeptidyl aminopeptidase/acylaminoacyl peptidase
MSEPHIAPYGSWKSPVTAEMLVTGRVGLDNVLIDGTDVYWVESRPHERGRQTIMRLSPGDRPRELLPPPLNARSRVHEYGGAPFTASGGTLFFSNFADNRLYRLDPASPDPRPITPEANLRYADVVVDAPRGRLVCIREDHTNEPQEAVNTIVALNPNNDPTGDTVLVQGCDFCSSPRISPDGARLAWLQWNHPNMPWDGCELWLGDFDSHGLVTNRVKVAGGPTEAICQPEWSPDGTLYFIDEQTGWWNLYRFQDGKSVPLHPMPAEFGVPHWVFGTSTYAFESSDRIVCTYSHLGIRSIAVLDPHTGDLRNLPTPFTAFSQVRAMPGYAVAIADSPSDDTLLVRINLDTGAVETLQRSGTLQISPDYISVAQPIEFPTTGGRTAYGFYYPPKNSDFVAPEGEKPPLLVLSHGGPTSATSSALSLRTQFWTSRGIAVLDVNYGGSTGYGREYRHRLDGQWGIVDVDDCVNGALYLVNQGLADGNRLAIRGGSAGGFTTLNALTFHDVFRVGASYYGIADLEALAKDTHKFESRYGDNLVGPYPERRDLYIARSAIHHTDLLSCPIIFFQGLDDKVVPPAQSRMMVDALKQKGLPVAYIEFEGEGHGFRQAQNTIRATQAELDFYAKILNFTPARPPSQQNA